MNDFTKEELEDMHLVYRTFCIDDETQILRELTNLENGILSKIQTMIDNHCEHEWNFNDIMKELVLNPGMAFPVECKKCGSGFK